MPLSVVGLPLEAARALLDDEGILVDSIETSQPPDKSGHPPPPDRICEPFVAGQWQTAPGRVRLRVVSVPPIEAQ